MTGLSTLTVELEDGSGNFTNDVSQYVRLDKGWSLSRGWSSENDEDDIQPALLRLRLDNTDGKFTLGAANFNGITKHKRIRLSETVGGTTYRRFVGYVNDWPTEWDSAQGNLAFASVICADRFMRLNRRKLRSITEQEILLDSPAAYYTLSEAAGSTSAGDTSGNGRPVLTLTSTGTAPTFGSTGPNTWDGLTACTFAGGQYLRGANAYLSSAAPFSLTVAFQVSTPPTNELLLAGLGVFQGLAGASSPQIYMSSGGLLRARAVIGTTVISPATNYADSAWHVAELVGSGGTWTLYVDGASVGSGAASAMPTTGAGFDLTVAFDSDAPAGAGRGLVAHVACFAAANSAARAAAHANAIRNGFATDRADQRIARLASYANIATADQNLETGLQSAMAVQSTTGQSTLDAMRDVAQSEGGGVFIAGDGKLTLHNKSHRVLKATGTPALTIAADQIDPDMTWASDNYLFNTATGTRSGGATQRVVNTVSIGKYEEWPITRDSALLPTDELVLNELQWFTTMYGAPLARLASVTFDVLTLPQATVQSILALELGDLVRITGWPSQSPSSSIDLIVEGFEEKQTEKAWSITFNTAPGSLFRAWILDSATYSVEDSTTRLYF